MISRNTVKSNASRVQPSQPAHQASHCSLVGSFHQGRSFIAETVVAMGNTSNRPTWAEPKGDSAVQLWEVEWPE